jgi:hypothetical protein
MTGCPLHDPRPHQVVINRASRLSPQCTSSKKAEKREKTACSEPLMTRQPRTGSYDPAGYFISVSAVI